MTSIARITVYFNIQAKYTVLLDRNNIVVKILTEDYIELKIKLNTITRVK